MKPTAYRQKWQQWRDGPVDAESLRTLSQQVAGSFLEAYLQRNSYEPAYIDLLCEMATSFDKPELNGIAASALFTHVIEKLCDDFEELPVAAYVRVMCRIIECCRQFPAGRPLNETLGGFGIKSPDDLQRRAMAVHTQKRQVNVRKPPQRIVLLSRVTIGADVAILTVMIQRLTRLFPKSEIVVVGDAKLHGLLDGNPAVRLRELNYARRGGLFERFSAWYAVLDIVRAETPAGGEQDLLVIDPDSRMTQLGVLPLIHNDNYLFFNTRDPALSATGRCMAELTNDWIDAVFDVPDFHYPTLWIAPALLAAAGSRVERLRAAGAKRIIAINFGFGGNPRKQVSPEFEKHLVRTLAALPDTVVILDRGWGSDEIARSQATVAYVRQSGLAGVETCFAHDDFPAFAQGVVAVESSIGEMAALIRHSDEYLGYDSACQHIAAAAGTPTLTVFAGSDNMGFVRRWSACGATDCCLVHVDTLSDPSSVDADRTVARIMHERAGRAARSMPVPIRAIRMDEPRSEPARRSVAP
jgi:ADP-heptose:LPS heptosyltransferase